MEHYITEVNITKLRHLSNINIKLDADKRQHLLLTGKNGSGKTTVLCAIKQYLQAICDGKLNNLKVDYVTWLANSEDKLAKVITENERFEEKKKYDRYLSYIQRYSNGMDIAFKDFQDLDSLYNKGQYVIAYFSAERKTQIEKAQGVEDIKLNNIYGINDKPGNILLKYMVHLKTQQAYARSENDKEVEIKVQKWFERFENALRILLDDNSIRLQYDFKQYDFKILMDGREPFSFDQLSDGYSSVINIVSELILRMDKNWLLTENLSEYDIEGIVMIDELETHLHIELQRKILPFLIEFFPCIQFVVTTHSPYILNSISNAKIYDLEKYIELEDFSGYSAEDIVEGYFESEQYSEALKLRLQKYMELIEKKVLSDDERAERAKLRREFNDGKVRMSKEVEETIDELENRKELNGKI